MNQNSNSIVILANGSYPKHPIPLNFLSKQYKILCCDGAVDKLIKTNIKPDIIIGDLDSISKKSLRTYDDLIIHKSNQNVNDLYKALEWCNQNNYSNVILLGASGKREDHTIGNIFLLFEFSHYLNLKMITDEGIFTLVYKNTIFKSYKNQPVSIFSIDKTIKIKTEKLNYPINNSSLKNLFSGTLNSSNSNEFSVNISHGLVLVFQKHSDNRNLWH